MYQRLRKLVAHEGSCLKLAPSGGKILCTLTGHELALQYDTVHTFIKGRKYQRLKAAAEAKEALRKYEPFVVQSKNFEDKLYCALTCQLLSKSLDAVRQHMGGKKFQRAKEQYQNDELELMEEPSLKDSPPDTEAAAPMEAQEGPGSSTAPTAEAAGPAGSSEAAEADGLWVPNEYVQMEAQAATEAAEAVHLDGTHEAASGGGGASAGAGPGAKGSGPMANGSGPSSARRPKSAKPKHRAKKPRLT